MATRLLIIAAASVATVVAMFILGKMADGKDKSNQSGHSEKKG